MIILNKTGTEPNFVISGSYNGIQFGVSFDETKWQLMQELQNRANKATEMSQLQAIMDEFKPLTEESYKELVEHKTPYIMVNKSTNKFYLKYGNAVSKEPLPQIFVDRIVKSVEKNIDIAPLIKCWARYMRAVPGRPAYSLQRAKEFAAYIAAPFTNSQLVAELEAKGLAHEVATDRATTTQVAITQEGLLVCYKVSREILKKYTLNEDEEVVQKSRYKKNIDEDTGYITFDSPEHEEEKLFEPYCVGQSHDAFYCGDKLGHFIRVGHPHYLPEWKQVGPPMGPGLHCGGLNYISGFQNGQDAVTHNIFVDPMDIHSVSINPTGKGNDGAMTVKRYFVHGTFKGVNKNIYHSSSYAALTDAEYAKIIEEVVEATKMKQAELDEQLKGAKALAIVSADSSDGTPVTDTAKLFVEGQAGKQAE